MKKVSADLIDVDIDYFIGSASFKNSLNLKKMN